MNLTPLFTVFSILAMIMVVGAFLSLWRSDVEKTAATVGDAWLIRINADAGSLHAPVSPAATRVG